MILAKKKTNSVPRKRPHPNQYTKPYEPTDNSKEKVNEICAKSAEFETGDFITNRLDVLREWPVIWRVNSASLLQKFEPIQINSKTVYRSISTVIYNIYISPTLFYFI